MHEKGLRRQKGVGPLFSSQVLVSVINRVYTAGQPLVNRWFCFCVGFKYELDCSCFRRVVQDSVPDSLQNKKGVVSWPDRPNGVPSYAAPPSLAAPPCAAPTRPTRSVSGFLIRKFPGHALHEKCFTETNRCRYTDQQPGTKSDRGPDDQPVVNRGLRSSICFLGHALHEKGLQIQIGVGTLVSSQEQRALLVLLINWLTTAGQPRVLFLHRFT